GLHRRLWALLRALPRGLAALNRRFDVSQPESEYDTMIAAAPEAPLAVLDPDLDDIAGPADPDLADAVPAKAKRRKKADPPEDEKPPTQLGMDMETPVAQWRHSADGWQLPPTKMLTPQPAAEDREADNKRRAALIEQTLSSFAVDSKVVEINEGP